MIRLTLIVRQNPFNIFKILNVGSSLKTSLVFLDISILKPKFNHDMYK